MKPFVLTFITALFLFSYQSTAAQNLWQTNPKECKILRDTLGAKLLLITLQPGDSLAPHTHSPYMIYFIQGGDLTEYVENGRAIHASISSGRTAQSPGQSVHSDRNSGESTIKFIMIEFSDH